MKGARIVTSFLVHDGYALILKRSRDVRTMKGKWAGVSGYIEKEDTLDAAIREVWEETRIGKNDLRLLARSTPLKAYGDDRLWIVYPFLFYTYNTNIILDKEHDEYRWIKPESIRLYDTVPRLADTLYSLLAEIGLYPISVLALDYSEYLNIVY